LALKIIYIYFFKSIKQILDVRMAISNLNSTVSKMTTLVAFAFTEKFLIGNLKLMYQN